MAFIRKVKTKSGATAVQVVQTVHGKVTQVAHIGSAHNEAELQLLMNLAKQRLQGAQRSLDLSLFNLFAKLKACS